MLKVSDERTVACSLTALLLCAVPAVLLISSIIQSSHRTHNELEERRAGHGDGRAAAGIRGGPLITTFRTMTPDQMTFTPDVLGIVTRRGCRSHPDRNRMVP